MRLLLIALYQYPYLLTYFSLPSNPCPPLPLELETQIQLYTTDQKIVNTYNSIGIFSFCVIKINKKPALYLTLNFFHVYTQKANQIASVSHCGISQYLVGPPWALITAWRRSVIDSASFSSRSLSNVVVPDRNYLCLELNCWCKVLRPNFLFQYRPQIFNRVEVRWLGRPVEGIPTLVFDELGDRLRPVARSTIILQPEFLSLEQRGLGRGSRLQTPVKIEVGAFYP